MRLCLCPCVAFISCPDAFYVLKHFELPCCWYVLYKYICLALRKFWSKLHTLPIKKMTVYQQCLNNVFLITVSENLACSGEFSATRKTLWKFYIQKMRLCLLLCILCLLAPGGYNQHPVSIGPSGERTFLGKPGVGGFSKHYV